MNTKLFVSPHNDDAVLFGAFTLQRERPMVLTVFDSFVQVERGHPECNADARREEDVRAINVVLQCAAHHGFVPDTQANAAAAPAVHALLSQWRRMTEVWIPAVELGGHDQHNLIGALGREIFDPAVTKVRRYLTYTRLGGKSTEFVPADGSVGIAKQVPCTGLMVRRKLQALTCYKTQLEIDDLGCWQHFIRDQNEYVID